MENPVRGIVENSKIRKNLTFLGVALGVMASGILVLNYFQNRKYYAKQRELANLQEELLLLQIQKIKNEGNGYTGR